jgi:Ca-activated chloride channel family protein
MKIRNLAHLLVPALFALSNFAALPMLQAQTADQLDVLFILDASGSMKQMTGGKSQIDAAKESMAAVLKDFPEAAQVGLRVYAHRENQSDKAKSCLDTELMAPLKAGGAQSIVSALSAIQPKGYTPISYSLEQARNDFSGSRESQKTIILLSDGEETCGGDPAATVEKLLADGFKFTLNVIGFNVDSKTRAQLEAAALAGGGQYYGAKDANELGRALSDATKASLVINKTKTVYGEEIRGGDSFESAVPIELGKEYRLNHHQKQAEYDYFSIPAKAAQEIVVTLKTLEKGIIISKDGKAKEFEIPYFGGKLNAPNRETLVAQEITGKKFDSKELRASVGQDGNFYLLIGSEYGSINKDHATFIAKIVSRGDLDTEADAVDNLEAAAPIEANRRYRKNYLGGADRIDTYSFNAKAGEKYFVGFIPTTQKTHTATQIKIITEYKDALISRGFSNGEGGKTDTLEIKEDGTYFVQISSDATNVDEYAFELKLLDSVEVKTNISN